MTMFPLSLSFICFGLLLFVKPLNTIAVYTKWKIKTAVFLAYQHSYGDKEQ